MALKVVLFDAADTLFHTRGTVGEIYWTVARPYGCTATPEAIHRAFVQQFRASAPLATPDEKGWWKDLVRRVFEQVGMISDFDQFFEQLYDVFRDSSGWMLFPETREVLAELKRRGFRLGIVSNFDSRLFTVLESLGIRSFFDTVTISSRTRIAKPDPRIFLDAVHSLAVFPAETLFVGDSPPDDILGADQAGLRALLIDRKERYAATDGVRRISSLHDVLSIIST